MKKPIYLDYAAATPLDSKVLAAMQPYWQSRFYNPSATYLAGRTARSALEEARHKVAIALGSKPAEIVFTAGTTEANNLAIQGVLKNLPGGEIIISAIEHESVLAPAKLFNSKQAPVNKNGVLEIEKLKKLVNDKTVLVSVMLVNNETGAIQPIKEISAYLRQIRTQRVKKGIKTPIYLHTDAAQAPCYVDIHVARLGINVMSINGGKIYGPKQSGVLYVKTGTPLNPIILGGGQEGGLRSGTENVAGCVGLAEALQKAVNLRQAETQKLRLLKDAFIKGLAHVNGASLNGSAKNASPHIVNVLFSGADNERLMMQLDETGVQAAVGSACSASSDEPSHVLRAMGLSTKDIRSSLRFSFGRQTSNADIVQTLKLLKEFVNTKNFRP